MNDIIDNDTYRKLLADISSVYEEARMSFVKMYWQIGKYIIEHEQKSRRKAEYGERLLERLSGDLSEKFGKGFSATNLRYMRVFYRTYSIQQISAKLDWSNYVTLLGVKDEEKRKHLETRAIEEGLNYLELRRLAKPETGEIPDRTTFLPLPVRGRLNTYPVIDQSRSASPENIITIDCGFNIWKSLAVKDPGEFKNSEFVSSRKKGRSFEIKEVSETERTSLYTYTALVEKIIDGDTLWVIVECGFDIRTRQKLRLRSIDTPEMDTAEGKRAKRFVERVLKGLPFVIVKTYKSDKYDRYLTDLFYLPGVDEPDRVAGEGRFLNGELVERGLGVVV